MLFGSLAPVQFVVGWVGGIAVVVFLVAWPLYCIARHVFPPAREPFEPVEPEPSPHERGIRYL